MIILDIDTGSRQEIVAFEGDNTKELTTIALVKDNNRIDLTGKTITLGYTDVNSQSVGDIIENITISNPKQGEITLPIDSKITKKDGFYNCAFKIVGEGGYKKFTAPFRLWIKANLFTSISKAIINTDTFNSIKEILSNADKLKQDLSNAETTLSNINNANIEAKENIKNLQDNSNKAIELNKTLTSNVASVDSKNKVLQDSIKAAEDFSKTLKGGTDFVQMRKDIDTLENNLKDTQSLSYAGSNITCNNSLEGRTTGLKLCGRTLQNLIVANEKTINQQEMVSIKNSTLDFNINRIKGINFSINYKPSFKSNTEYTLVYNLVRNDNIKTNDTKNCFMELSFPSNKNNFIINLTKLGINSVKIRTSENISNDGVFSLYFWEGFQNTNTHITIKDLMIFETSTLKNIDINSLNYFEEIKGASDKTKNLFNSEILKNRLKEDWYEFKTEGNTRTDAYFIISSSRDANHIICNGSNTLKNEFTTTQQTNYYCCMGVNGDRSDDKEWIEIKLKPNTKYIFSCNYYKEINLIKYKDIQIEEGTKVTEFESYYKGEKVKYKSIGKNLFNPVYSEKNSAKSVIFDKTNNTITFKQNNERFIAWNKEPIDNVTISFVGIEGECNIYFEFLDGTGDNIQGLGFKKFKANKPIKGIRSNWTNEGKSVIKDFQIEKGDFTSYEHYKEDNKEILLPQGLSFNGLDTIQDTIEETEKGVVYNQNIGKIVLNGTEDWANFTTEPSTLYRATLRIPNMKINPNILCDKLPYIPWGKHPWDSIEECYSIQFGENTIFIYLKNTDTLNKIKERLKELKLIFYYQLAEPKTYLLPGIEETDIDTYNIITYVKSLNTIPATIDFNVATNYGSLLMQHSQEINKIWDTIYNIVYPVITENAVEISKAQAKNLLN